MQDVTPIHPSLRWQSRFVEYGGLAVATVCFAAAICAAARAFYLAEEHSLSLAMFALLVAVGGSFTWLGCQIVLAIAAWLERARALSSTLGSHPPDSDPSPRPLPRDSRC
ncbi:MAG TPA: hypothetical protein VFY49_02150 [Myxococcota bacterium]|nr:hypothetical protein [Myxococcota bacterium]